MFETPFPQTGTLVRAGYVNTAPACGDCKHSIEPDRSKQASTHHLVCAEHGAPVQDGGRCTSWTPDRGWLRANPSVAKLYTAQAPAISPAEEAPPISPAEQHYLHHEHSLRA